jgi:virulence-associated protein VagC
MPRTRKQSKSKSERRQAKVFWTGRSQAVRLPKQFRFEVDEVLVHREGHKLVLEPIEIERDARGWPTAWWKLAGSAPDFNVGERPRTHERRDILGRRD